jgi:hypothetical protein
MNAPAADDLQLIRALDVLSAASDLAEGLYLAGIAGANALRSVAWRSWSSRGSRKRSVRSIATARRSKRRRLRNEGALLLGPLVAGERAAQHQRWFTRLARRVAPRPAP